jgi:hypothetical protein
MGVDEYWGENMQYHSSNSTTSRSKAKMAMF